MANFWKIVNRIIAKADIILEVIDARFIDKTRNPEIEQKILRAKKLFIIVANKSDLVEDEGRLRLRLAEVPNSVMMSSKEKLGTTILKRKILSLAAKERVKIGVVGYPNTGKSSVINALAGRSKAKTSSQSGYTRGFQFIRAGPRIMMIDTPGVIPFKRDDEPALASIGSVDANHVKDPEGAAYRLIDNNTEKICRHYSIDQKKLKDDDPETIIEEIARKKKLLISGGKPNMRLTSIRILNDWQKGTIRQG